MKCLEFFHIFLVYIHSSCEKPRTKALSTLTQRNLLSYVWEGEESKRSSFSMKSNKTWLLRSCEDRAVGIFPSALFSRKFSHNSLWNDQWIIKCLFANATKQCRSPTPVTKRYTLQKAASLSFCHGKDGKEDWKLSEVTVIKSRGLEKKKTTPNQAQQQIFIQMLCLNAFSAARKCLHQFAMLFLCLALWPMWLAKIWLQIVSV